MQRTLIALGFVSLFTTVVALVSASERLQADASQPTAKAEVIQPDVYSARVDARDYLRNPDGTARIVFSNTTSQTVDVTLCGSKNAQEAASRFGETGPFEVRAGFDIGTDTQLLGSVMRNQPYFALHVRVPGGSPEKPMHLFLWNGDRDRSADLVWRLLVGSAR
ncbi:MAG: hypothetical protein IPN34_04205 [Planctomycetes bacterium]|nr:hypothetical protein [Planctomycetota bacterium]